MIAERCGFVITENGKIFNFIEDKFYYDENNDEIHFFEDILAYLGHNFETANFVWQHIMNNYFYSPYTFIDECINEGDMVEMIGKYYLAEGEVLTCQSAQDFCRDALVLWQTGQKEKTIEVGGFWQEENGLYQAFDNRGQEMTIESFKDQTEALKYASGEMATTMTGYQI